MKCPKCGEEMEEGYVFLDGGSLRWSKEKMKHRVLSLRYPEGTIKIMSFGAVGFPPEPPDSWIKQGFRCANCKLITFEY